MSVSEAKDVPGLLEIGPEPGEVLDDPVMDDRDPVGLVQVRMGVAVGGRTVGGPPGVSDAGGRRRQRAVAERFLEVGEFAGSFGRGKRAIGDDGHAGRVVAAVFQPAQPLHHDVERLLVADVSHDPAHGRQGIAPGRMGL